MSKVKQVFVCQHCGAESPKWIGKCPQCEEWNTYEEEIISKNSGKKSSKTSFFSAKADKKYRKPVRLDEIQTGKEVRIKTAETEFDRVLGGGIVPGALTLIGGEPGIGKSTLLLQIALQLKEKVLYVSGEESEEQLKLRASRLGLHSQECYFLTETDVEKIFQVVQSFQPSILIIDSIQTLSTPFVESMPGSVTQIRACASELQRAAKETNIPIFMIGHINKEGAIAGPKILEHIVDTVLQFEGDRQHAFRILRTIKNRFGSTDELGIYEMSGQGLRPVANPSELLLSDKEDELSGSAVAATIEGARPMLIEVQALVSTAVYGTPQRSATGFDLRRLSMLLAVLEKRCGFHFGQNDVFLNIAGGLRVDDTAIDLAVVAALISSLEDEAVSSHTCFAGEVGLNGEIRAVNRIIQRIQEADRLGFTNMYISAYHKNTVSKGQFNINVHFVSRIDEWYRQVFAR